MSKKNETIRVNNDKALADALKQKYGTIILEGDTAANLRKNLNKYSQKKKYNKIFGIGIFVGLIFWPVLLASLVGTVVTKDDLNKYNVDIVGEEIILKLKSLSKK